MSRYEATAVEIPSTAPNEGTPIRVADLDAMWISLVSADFDGVVGVDVSLDGSARVEVASETFSGSAKSVLVAVPQTCFQVRLTNKTDSGGDEPIAVIAGRNVRTM